MMAGSVEKRIEDEGFLAAFRRGGLRIASVGWIEHARRGGLLGFGIGRRRCGLRRRVRRRGVRLRGGRRQIEAAFASAAPERERGRAEQDDGPSRRARAVTTIHDEIPNAAAPYKDCPVLARPRQP